MLTVRFSDAESKSAIANIVHEINDSIQNQALAYKNGATFVPLWRPPIEYEQAITVGHATHPMNKSRVPTTEMNFYTALYDFNRVNILLYKVDKALMNIYGNYEEIMKMVAKKLNISYDSDTEIIIPVHELQSEVIKNYFSGTIQLRKIASVSGLSECSLRTVKIDAVSNYIFKLSLAMVISSTVRTITQWSALSGPALTEVIRTIIGDNRQLTFLSELGSIIVKNDDLMLSKHFTCIIREDVQVKLDDPLETAIVCAYLTEKCIPGGEYNITKLFDLKTQPEREKFSELYAKMLIDAFFDYVFKFGFSFEAHQQNVLLRVKKSPRDGYKLNGFIVRDFGGIKVHQDTLYSKIGRKVIVLDSNASILAKNLHEVYALCYHTLFHCHLQQVFKSLQMHYNGKGWRLVRDHLNTKHDFLTDDSCRNFFLGELVPYKCFLQMKLKQYERMYLYADVPNLINFKQN